ncbi:GCN5-related N-acetyltransferase (plasmid) [Gemmatirosa kalamazoonensis]|uniref:GCN5-related N-acetyltransferase n=1 Tax=Gemmatirosa kalamazoonensis TaxID=861299 RepID=W0RPU9_9BACT|nr:GNAT family N-acetyltransferase [Gemmatirosa kalamazoonensis]AHG92716.1 GCN5-related N-acetyltransferase [Gemmatirosa kalamazoonensis]
MHLERATDPATFVDDVSLTLVANEAGHGLLLGLLGAGRADPPPTWAYAALVRDGRDVVAVALRTDDKLVLSRAAPDAIALIAADALAGNSAAEVRALVGPPESVRAFAVASGRAWRTSMRQGVYTAHAVVPPTDVPGRRRVATAADRDTLIAWSQAFHAEALGERPAADVVAPGIDARVAAGAMHLWDVDGTPVAAAAAAGPTPNAIRVNFVYTPPDRRGRGYASALVASLTQRLLDEGRAFVFLHTDLANPVSNRVYERIGYRRAAEFEMLVPD